MPVEIIDGVEYESIDYEPEKIEPFIETDEERRKRMQRAWQKKCREKKYLTQTEEDIEKRKEKNRIYAERYRVKHRALTENMDYISTKLKFSSMSEEEKIEHRRKKNREYKQKERQK